VDFTLGGRRIRVDIGHLLFVLAIGAWCVWYLFDARVASTNLQNLLLIQPAVVVAVVLVLLVARSTIHFDPTPVLPAEGEPAPLTPAEDRREVLRVFGFMALLAVYLCVIPYLGLDVATFLFVAACLLGQGERRPHIFVGIPLIFTFAMVYGFKALLPIPIPTLFG
jgi:hypothetical protein